MSVLSTSIYVRMGVVLIPRRVSAVSVRTDSAIMKSARDVKVMHVKHQTYRISNSMLSDSSQ